MLVGSRAPELEEPWVVSVVSIGELHADVLLADDTTVRAQRLQRLAAVLAAAPIVAIEPAVASRYGQLRAATGRRPTNDLWIAQPHWSTTSP